jgi:hypothetical protein
MNDNKLKRYGSVASLVAAGLVGGGVLASSMSANAAAADTTTPAPAVQSSTAPTNPNPGDLSKPQRADETLLTGTTAEKVRAAALAEYPGATVQRVETDSEGVYEAHIVTDGKQLIVQVGKDFTVTGTQTMGSPGAAPGSTQAG